MAFHQPVFQVDAFTDQPFKGNLAAVCPMDAFPTDALLQSIAAEMNLAETAFFVPVDERHGHFQLRWFTPTTEVSFCGHATLASAHVIFSHINPEADILSFETMAGPLQAKRLSDGRIELDLPNLKPRPVAGPEGLADAMGAAPVEVLDARTGDHDLLLVYETEAQIAGLSPDHGKLASLAPYGFIVTAPGDGHLDFVSRCFFPAVGIPEDPVTGSAHCASGPYWANRLKKNSLRARQLSARGGDLWVFVGPDRVRVSGYASETLQGTLFLPE